MTTYVYYNQNCQVRCDSTHNYSGILHVLTVCLYFKEQSIHFDTAFSSTQERACDYLELITYHQMPYTRLKDLREKCYGIFEGRDEILLTWNYNTANVDQTMEKDEDVVARMHRAVVEILSGLEDGQTALVVGHGDILAKFVRDATENKNFGGFGNASIVKLTVDGKKIHFDSYVWPAEGLK